jgi:hypothetical protein
LKSLTRSSKRGLAGRGGGSGCAADPPRSSFSSSCGLTADSAADRALASAASAARRACRAASSAISPTSRTPSSEARAITSASSIRASSSPSSGTEPFGTTQSSVLSRCAPSMPAI